MNGFGLIFLIFLWSSWGALIIFLIAIGMYYIFLKWAINVDYLILMLPDIKTGIIALDIVFASIMY